MSVSEQADGRLGASADRAASLAASAVPASRSGITDAAATAGIAWLRELAATCKAEAQQWFDRSCEDEGQEWRVRGESYAFIADQIERGHSPFTARCGDAGVPLCKACSAPITELVQVPGCGAPA